jgi:hypothetical protein
MLYDCKYMTEYQRNQEIYVDFYEWLFWVDERSFCCYEWNRNV